AARVLPVCQFASSRTKDRTVYLLVFGCAARRLFVVVATVCEFLTGTKRRRH
uniref:Uncharacterized protein n=1 Tax=Anopheles albimanus TaxID=7167 RepID=A0A182FZ40_ANOAL